MCAGCVKRGITLSILPVKSFFIFTHFYSCFSPKTLSLLRDRSVVLNFMLPVFSPLLPQFPVLTLPPVCTSLTVWVPCYWAVNMLLQCSLVSPVVSKSNNERIHCYRGKLKWAVVTQEGWGRQKGWTWGEAERFCDEKQVQGLLAVIDVTWPSCQFNVCPYRFCFSVRSYSGRPLCNRNESREFLVQQNWFRSFAH